MNKEPLKKHKEDRQTIKMIVPQKENPTWLHIYNYTK